MVLFTGFATNGEWNSLRENGNTRPLSIFESVKEYEIDTINLKKENVNTKM